jgi:uncharacterized protein
MTNYHHGPEVVESGEGSSSVRDIKAATLFLVGTAPVNFARATLTTEQDIIIRSKDDAVKAFGAFKDGSGFTIPQALFSIFNKDRGSGVGTIIVRNVFDPAKHATPADVTPADIEGFLDTDGHPKGLEAACYTYGKMGYFPRLIIAPGFSTDVGVRTKMLLVARKIHAHAITDMPPSISKQAAIELRGVGQDYQTGDDRLVCCYPRVKALDCVTGEPSLQPYSTHYAGVWLEVKQREENDSDGGPASSPSNRAMPDVTGLETPLAYYPGDHSSDTNMLNEAGIVTVNMGMYGGGYQTWGAHASSFNTSSEAYKWLHVRSMYDILHESILFFLQEYIDKRGSLTRVEGIESKIQKYINRKERDNWLYGGQFSFNKSKNTPEEILNEGRFYYKLTSSPIAIMHRITVESFIDLKFIQQALGLSLGA